MTYVLGERWVNCATCTKQLYRKDCLRNQESKALVCRECYDAPIRLKKHYYSDPKTFPKKNIQPVPPLVYGGLQTSWNTIFTNWEDLTTTNWEDLQ